MSGPAPIIILDTNVLLDWCVFKDPSAQALGEALKTGRLRWLASSSMQTEWGHVWPRSVFARWQPDPSVTTAVFQHAEMVAEPPKGPFKCKDPDDQVFIDLAMHVKARWLLSKDAALLKLSRRAGAHGLGIATLQRWPGL